MKTMEWKTRDRSEWLTGEWDAEPDKAQWADAGTGLPCLAVRGPFGSWCGYVGVTEEHAHFRVCHSKVDLDYYVHGGLTFSSFCAVGEKAKTDGICHVPEPGEPDGVWWFGFDCAHGGDLMPGMSGALNRFKSLAWDEGAIYRSLEYVRAECARLAEQLAR